MHPAPGFVPLRGRGTSLNPPNRFDLLDVVWDGDELDRMAAEGEGFDPRTRYFKDSAKTIITRNESPDVGFETSINVYRGCSHGCCYCFARPFHEYLGYSAGLDFETRIMVKPNAPQLLRAELAAKKWRPQLLVMSGVTDPYQPVERRLKLTRACLEVLAEVRNPVGIITKNHLVTRDVDLLRELAACGAVCVNISLTTLRNELQRVMEPQTSVPARRLAAVETLARAGVPVGIMVAPLIPGLTDEEMPAILQAARAAGASWAGYVALRLPHAVKEIFTAWLAQHFPERKDKVLNRIRELRGGQLYDARWSVRGRGQGVMADQLSTLFHAARRRVGYPEDGYPTLSTEHFRRPSCSTQFNLFE